MMEKNENNGDKFKIKSWRIETEHIDLTNNFLTGHGFKIMPTFERKTGRLSDKEFFTSINANIKNTSENPFPLEISVCVRAIFQIESNDGCEKEIESFLKKQAIHILFPYLRVAITGLTNIAMVPPVVLPIVDAFRLFPDDEEGQKNLDETK